MCFWCSQSYALRCRTLPLCIHACLYLERRMQCCIALIRRDGRTGQSTQTDSVLQNWTAHPQQPTSNRCCHQDQPKRKDLPFRDFHRNSRKHTSAVDHDLASLGHRVEQTPIPQAIAICFSLEESSSRIMNCPSLGFLPTDTALRAGEVS